MLGEGQHLGTSAWWLYLAGEKNYLPLVPVRWSPESCLVLERVTLTISHQFCVGVGGWDPFLAKGAICSLQGAAQCSQKQNWGWGGDKMFGFCIIHLCAMIQVESECSFIFHTLRVWSLFVLDYYVRCFIFCLSSKINDRLNCVFYMSNCRENMRSLTYAVFKVIRIRSKQCYESHWSATFLFTVNTMFSLWFVLGFFFFPKEI